ncbi:hypothetical protein [Micromonospora sp. NPDC005161]
MNADPEMAEDRRLATGDCTRYQEEDLLPADDVDSAVLENPVDAAARRTHLGPARFYAPTITLGSHTVFRNRRALSLDAA